MVTSYIAIKLSKPGPWRWYMCVIVLCYFITCVDLGNHHPGEWDTELSHHHEELPLSSPCHIHSLLGTTPKPWQLPLCSSSLIFVMLKMLHKWNHTVSDFYRMAFRTQHNASEIHLSCCMCQQYVPLYCWIAFHGMDIYLAIHLLKDFWLFPVLGYFK